MSVMTDDEIKQAALYTAIPVEMLPHAYRFADKISSVSNLRGYDEGMREMAGNILQILRRDCSDIERVMLAQDYCMHILRDADDNR